MFEVPIENLAREPLIRRQSFECIKLTFFAQDSHILILPLISNESLKMGGKYDIPKIFKVKILTWRCLVHFAIYIKKIRILIPRGFKSLPTSKNVRTPMYVLVRLRAAVSYFTVHLGCRKIFTNFSGYVLLRRQKCLFTCKNYLLHRGFIMSHRLFSDIGKILSSSCELIFRRKPMCLILLIVVRVSTIGFCW